MTIDEVRALLDKATKGPWFGPHFASDDTTCDCGYIFAEGDERTVCKVYTEDDVGNEDMTREEAIANGKLIAAAPALARTAIEALGNAHQFRLRVEADNEIIGIKTKRIAELEADIRTMVDKAAAKNLDGYRELGQRAAAAESRVDKLTTDLQEANDAVGRYYDLNVNLTAENKRLRENLRISHALNTDEIWYWQGDGEDHLESLVCPVVISAEALAALTERETTE